MRGVSIAIVTCMALATAGVLIYANFFAEGQDTAQNIIDRSVDYEQDAKFMSSEDMNNEEVAAKEQYRNSHTLRDSNIENIDWLAKNLGAARLEEFRSTVSKALSADAQQTVGLEKIYVYKTKSGMYDLAKKSSKMNMETYYFCLESTKKDYYVGISGEVLSFGELKGSVPGVNISQEEYDAMLAQQDKED